MKKYWDILIYTGWGRGSCPAKKDPDHREWAWPNSGSSYAGQREIRRERQGSAKRKSSKYFYYSINEEIFGNIDRIRNEF